jgi:hypothetical protein
VFSRNCHRIVVAILLFVVGGGVARAMPPDRCGTGVVSVPPPSRGLRTDAVLDTDHFRLHYATFGQGMIAGWPDPTFRDALVGYLEAAYVTFRDDPRMALREPVGTGPIGAAGRPLIEVEVTWLPEYYGVAHPVGYANPPCSGARTAYITLNNHFDDAELYQQARLTSAHELFHLMQMASSGPTDFFGESTAAWSELFVWPDDWGHLGEWVFLDSPYLSLMDLTGYREYAAAIFWYFLDHAVRPASGRYPAAEVVWRTCDRTWYTALGELAEEAGTDRNRLVHEFAVWNHYTNIFDDGRHYDHGDAFIRTVKIQASHETYPVLDASVAPSRLATWTGSNYLRFWGRASRERLRVTIEGDPGVERRATAIGTVVPNTHVQLPTRVSDADGRVEIVVEDWNLFDQLLVVVTNPEFPQILPGGGLPSLDYTYSAAEEGAETVDLPWSADAAPLVFAPNPTASGTFLRFDVIDEGVPTRIEIFDVTGRLVRRVLDERLPVGTHNKTWDGCDEAGRAVAVGNYFVALSRGGNRVVRSVTVVR